jgi:hypothetical protein
MAPKHPADRRFEPLMSIGDDKLDPEQAASRQAFQKARPERLGFRRADVQPDNLASAVSIGGHGDYRGNRDDAAAFALLQVGGVEPQIPPLAGEGPIQKGVNRSSITFCASSAAGALLPHANNSPARSTSSCFQLLIIVG